MKTHHTQTQIPQNPFPSIHSSTYSAPFRSWNTCVRMHQSQLVPPPRHGWPDHKQNKSNHIHQSTKGFNFNLNPPKKTKERRRNRPNATSATSDKSCHALEGPSWAANVATLRLCHWWCFFLSHSSLSSFSLYPIYLQHVTFKCQQSSFVFVFCFVFCSVVFGFFVSLGSKFVYDIY